MKHITIIEDDSALSNGIVLALKKFDYSFTQHNLLSEFDRTDPTDLIILDINLPDGSGFDFLKSYRIFSDTPVIILSAKDLETDEVMGLEYGAEDYITKPFSLMVLRARIDKLINRRELSLNDYTDDRFCFCFDKMKFFADGTAVELSKTEQKLLRLFIMNKNQILSRDILIDRIWSDNSEFVDENALCVTVNRLRRKLSCTDEIRTVYGIGYIWRTK